MSFSRTFTLKEKALFQWSHKCHNVSDCGAWESITSVISKSLKWRCLSKSENFLMDFFCFFSHHLLCRNHLLWQPQLVKTQSNVRGVGLPDEQQNCITCWHCGITHPWMCFYTWRGSSGCHLFLQFRPFSIPYLLQDSFFNASCLSLSSSAVNCCQSYWRMDMIWESLWLPVNQGAQRGPGCPFFWVKQAGRLLPAQPCQEVNLQYWQHQMFTVQLPALWNHEIGLKWRRLKITIRWLLSYGKDLTSAVKCFFRPNF